MLVVEFGSFCDAPVGSSKARGQDSELESSDGHMDEDSADDTFS